MPVYRKILKALVATVGLGATAIGYAAYAVPNHVACLMVKSIGLKSLPDGTLVESESSELERGMFIQLQSQARARIEERFGPSQARGYAVAFFQNPTTFWPLNVNDYGSEVALGGRACVIIGPKGHNVDVVAHEFMHRELSDRIGFWQMATEVPVWFIEGVAMQVDYRGKYELANDMNPRINTAAVRQLRRVNQFNYGDDQQITRHYAFAKAEVAQWLSKVGHHELYPRFERIRNGEGFNVVVTE